MPQRQLLGAAAGRQGWHRLEELDNRFARVDDPAALQEICDGLGPEQIDGLLRKWLARLPRPFSPTDRAAARHEAWFSQMGGVAAAAEDVPAFLRAGVPAACWGPRR